MRGGGGGGVRCEGLGKGGQENGEGMGEREKDVQIIGQKLFLTYIIMPQ